MASKINLEKVKAYYIKNEISFKDVSSMFGVNVETVRKRAYKENWQDLKADYKNSLYTSPPPSEEEETAKPEDIKALSLKAISKLMKLINKSIYNTLPSETDKIKALTQALSETLKTFNLMAYPSEEETPATDTLKHIDLFMDLVLKFGNNEITMPEEITQDSDLNNILNANLTEPITPEDYHILKNKIKSKEHIINGNL